MHDLTGAQVFWFAFACGAAVTAALISWLAPSPMTENDLKRITREAMQEDQERRYD